MAKEIEKKFLVNNNDWRDKVGRSRHYKQGYLGNTPDCSVRVRVSDKTAFLNIKSATLGISRDEYDYEIPLSDALEMLDNLCNQPIIEKTRYFVQEEDGLEWEIDVFAGDNEGLVVAEIELEHPQQTFHLPEWAGEEVSDDPRYYNVCLVTHPYKDW